MAGEAQGGLSEAEIAYFDTEGETPHEGTENAEAQAKATDEAKTGVLDDDARKAIEGNGEEEEKGSLVNYGALHKERAKRRELETEVGGLKQFKAAMEEKMRWTEALLTPGAEQKTDQDPEPDPNQDIFAHNAWLSRQLAAEKQGNAERVQSEKQAKEAVEFEGKVWTYWNQSAAAYKKDNPEFEDAVKFISETRTQQLRALSGLHPAFKTEAGIVQQINKELFEINVAAAQNGISPAEYIHNMAKEWGYKGKPADPAPIVLPDKLKNVDKAIAANRTVGAAASGSSGGDEMSIDSLAAMPQGEFNDWMKVPANEKTFRRLMGG